MSWSGFVNCPRCGKLVGKKDRDGGGRLAAHDCTPRRDTPASARHSGSTQGGSDGS